MAELLTPELAAALERGNADRDRAAMQRARAEFPDSDSVRLFLALSLHAATQSDAAMAELLELVADRIRTPEITRYEAAIRGNAAYLRELGTTPGQRNRRERRVSDRAASGYARVALPRGHSK